MKSFALISVFVVTACASSGSTSGSSQDPTLKHIPYGDTDLGTYGVPGSPVTWSDVHAPVLTTWQYLPIAYSRLGLTITRYDSAAHVIEGTRERSGADFGGTSLGKLLNCGEVAGVPNVTRYEVTLQVRTTLRGSDTSSVIANQVSASARPGELSGDTVPCMVNNGIGERIATTVAGAIAEGSA
ncbi:MAG: hypothetical protein ABI338_00690 [Gemmatimonadaceae bacterium]